MSWSDEGRSNDGDNLSGIVYYGRMLNDSAGGTLAFMHDAWLAKGYFQRWTIPGQKDHARCKRCHRLASWFLAALFVGSYSANVYYIYASTLTCVEDSGMAINLRLMGIYGFVLSTIQAVKFGCWLHGEPGNKIRGPDVDRSRPYQLLSFIALMLSFHQLVVVGLLIQHLVEFDTMDCWSLKFSSIVIASQCAFWCLILGFFGCCGVVFKATLKADLLDHEILKHQIDAAEVSLRDEEMIEFETELQQYSR
eukprot:TRINITY_DN7979_c0_g1_i1.p1 TRINITY_DN7979_c0_g1~~TRINITY_DN7979_c0_g1_i1.p1  ORF type:complete len:251 (+),score=22.82 TRINITY_DN7979_c0_g1_i1:158-910(+)